MHPVRSIAITLLLSVAPLYAAAQPQSIGLPASVTHGSVQLQLEELVETHGRRADITKICRSAHGVKGCTDFPMERLKCNCELRGDRWQINARAEIQAVIHLSKNFRNDRILLHERMHLEDLEIRLREHLERIAGKEYESESACRIYARVLTISPHLREVMNDIRIASNEKYGCARDGAF